MTELGDLVSLKAFDSPDGTRLFEKGKFDIFRIGGTTMGRATYQPDWRWSLHVGPACLARPITRFEVRKSSVIRAFMYV